MVDDYVVASAVRDLVIAFLMIYTALTLVGIKDYLIIGILSFFSFWNQEKPLIGTINISCCNLMQLSFTCLNCGSLRIQWNLSIYLVVQCCFNLYLWFSFDASWLINSPLRWSIKWCMRSFKMIYLLCYLDLQTYVGHGRVFKCLTWLFYVKFQ